MGEILKHERIAEMENSGDPVCELHRLDYRDYSRGQAFGADVGCADEEGYENDAVKSYGFVKKPCVLAVCGELVHRVDLGVREELFDLVHDCQRVVPPLVKLVDVDLVARLKIYVTLCENGEEISAVRIKTCGKALVDLREDAFACDALEIG